MHICIGPGKRRGKPRPHLQGGALGPHAPRDAAAQGHEDQGAHLPPERSRRLRALQSHHRHAAERRHSHLPQPLHGLPVVHGRQPVTGERRTQLDRPVRVFRQQRRDAVLRLHALVAGAVHAGRDGDHSAEPERARVHRYVYIYICIEREIYI